MNNINTEGLKHFITKREVFQTPDGCTFDTESAAIAHMVAKLSKPFFPVLEKGERWQHPPYFDPFRFGVTPGDSDSWKIPIVTCTNTKRTTI